jgi:hypothetical protein
MTSWSLVRSSPTKYLEKITRLQLEASKATYKDCGATDDDDDDDDDDPS